MTRRMCDVVELVFVQCVIKHLILRNSFGVDGKILDLLIPGFGGNYFSVCACAYKYIMHTHISQIFFFFN